MMQITRPDGQESQVQLAYERLPNFCYYYGILGHLVKDCHACMDLVNEEGEVLEDKLLYGDWLRTHPNALQSRFVNGSFSRSYGRSHRPCFSTSSPVSANTRDVRTTPVSSGSRSAIIENNGLAQDTENNSKNVEVSNSRNGKSVTSKGKEILTDTSGAEISGLELALIPSSLESQYLILANSVTPIIKDGSVADMCVDSDQIIPYQHQAASYDEAHDPSPSHKPICPNPIPLPDKTKISQTNPSALAQSNPVEPFMFATRQPFIAQFKLAHPTSQIPPAVFPKLKRPKIIRRTPTPLNPSVSDMATIPVQKKRGRPAGSKNKGSIGGSVDEQSNEFGDQSTKKFKGKISVGNLLPEQPRLSQ